MMKKIKKRLKMDGLKQEITDILMKKVLYM